MLSRMSQSSTAREPLVPVHVFPFVIVRLSGYTSVLGGSPLMPSQPGLSSVFVLSNLER